MSRATPYLEIADEQIALAQAVIAKRDQITPTSGGVAYSMAVRDHDDAHPPEVTIMLWELVKAARCEYRLDLDSLETCFERSDGDYCNTCRIKAEIEKARLRVRHE